MLISNTLKQKTDDLFGDAKGLAYGHVNHPLKDMIT